MCANCVYQLTVMIMSLHGCEVYSTVPTTMIPVSEFIQNSTAHVHAWLLLFVAQIIFIPSVTLFCCIHSISLTKIVKNLYKFSLQIFSWMTTALLAVIMVFVVAPLRSRVKLAIKGESLIDEDSVKT